MSIKAKEEEKEDIKRREIKENKGKYNRKGVRGLVFCFENRICEALGIITPGVEVRLEYPRQAYIEIENFAVNIETKEYNILLINTT